MARIEKFFVNSRRHVQRVVARNERLLRHVDLRPGLRYLDVGCGNGAAPIHVAKTHGIDVTGVDIDPDQIREASASASGLENIRFAVEDATRLSFRDGTFDVVVTMKATHHIPAWEKAFGEMIRVVKVGGYLVYDDVITPRWLAPAGAWLVRKHAGFPTVRAIDTLILRHELEPIHRAPSWNNYTAVLRKP